MHGTDFVVGKASRFIRLQHAGDRNSEPWWILRIVEAKAMGLHKQPAHQNESGPDSMSWAILLALEPRIKVK